jgi:hypothetical protein
VGFLAGNNVTTANNVICIGTSVEGANVSDSCHIGNIYNQPGGSQAVYVSSQGKLGAVVSSRRFKEEIKPMAQASEVIYGLKPVSFRYTPEIEPTRPLSFGLIAEEAADQEQEATIAQLKQEFQSRLAKQQKQIEALTAGLQRVSAQIELSKAGPQIAGNSQ